MGLPISELEGRVQKLSETITSLIKEVYGNDGQSIPDNGLSRIDAITTELYGKNIENTADYPGAVSVLDNVVHEVWGDKKDEKSQNLGNADYSSYAAAEGIVASTGMTSRIDEGMTQLSNVSNATNNNSNAANNNSNTTNNDSNDDTTDSGSVKIAATTYDCVTDGNVITRGGVNVCAGGFYLASYGVIMNLAGATVNTYLCLAEFAIFEFIAHLVGASATVAGTDCGVVQSKKAFLENLAADVSNYISLK